MLPAPEQARLPGGVSARKTILASATHLSGPSHHFFSPSSHGPCVRLMFLGSNLCLLQTEHFLPCFLAPLTSHTS